MQFPKHKDGIVLLAERMVAGITAHATDYPETTFATEELGNHLSAVKTAQLNRQDQEALTRRAVEQENSLCRTLALEMKKILYMAEAYHANDPILLSLISWGPSNDPSANPPSVPRDLSARILARGQVTLSWLAPTPNTGGAVRFYRVERHWKQPDTGWLDWGEDTSYSTTTRTLTLTNQPMSVEVEYRVVAINVVGESTPSSTLRLVL